MDILARHYNESVGSSGPRLLRGDMKFDNLLYRVETSHREMCEDQDIMTSEIQEYIKELDSLDPTKVALAALIFSYLDPYRAYFGHSTEESMEMIQTKFSFESWADFSR